MIPAIVLAAGTSSRMGRPKATLPLGTETFLTRIVRTFRAAGVEDIAIVVGHQAETIIADWPVRELAVRFVLNPEYPSGQLSSLLKGLDAVDAPGVSGTLMTLVDVPLVAASTVRAVIDRYRETGAAIVRPTRGAEHGHPVLIDRAVFAALRHADPDRGAKAVVRAHASPAGDLEIADAGAFLDIDTMAEYEQVIAGLVGKQPRS
jgi:molybdenum cofactor cytidylyltransferase